MLIEPIPADALDLTPEPPEFETLATLELGNAGSPSDGFDGLMAQTVTQLAATQGDLDGAAQAELEAGQQFPALLDDESAPTITELTAAHAEGEAVLTQFEVDLGIIEPPPPPPPPPTPVGTGGGGGGGTGGGGGGGEVPTEFPLLDSCPPTRNLSGPVCIGDEEEE